MVADWGCSWGLEKLLMNGPVSLGSKRAAGKFEKPGLPVQS